MFTPFFCLTDTYSTGSRKYNKRYFYPGRFVYPGRSNLAGPLFSLFSFFFSYRRFPISIVRIFNIKPDTRLQPFTPTPDTPDSVFKT